MMGQAEFGLYSLTASIVSYLTVLDFGFGNAIVRYTAKYRAENKKDEEQRLHGTFVIVYMIIALIAVILGMFLYINTENIFGNTMNSSQIEEIKVMLALLIFNLAATFIFGIFSSIITAHEEFVFAKVLSIIRMILNPCIMIPVLLMGHKAIGMVVVTTALNFICLAANTIFCFKKLKIKISFEKFDFTLFREVIGYSFYIFLNIIVDQVNWAADKFILGAITSAEMVAKYSLAAQLNSYYIGFSTAISNVFLPRVTAMVAKKASNEELSSLFIRIGRVQFIVMAYVMSAFILFGENFMILWGGEEYHSSFYIALLLMLPVTIPLIQNIGISILQAKNKQKFRTSVFFFIALFNIGISILLAKPLGGIGCAIGTALALLVGQGFVMNIYYYKKIEIDIPLFWRQILRLVIPVFLSCILGVFINYFLTGTGYMWLALRGVIYTLIFIPLIWFLGMNQYEHSLFGGPFVKILTYIKKN